MKNSDSSKKRSEPSRPPDGPARRRIAKRKLRTILDPVAMGVLDRLGSRPQTSGELADALGENPTKVRKRLAVLVATGQVEKLELTRRRGRPEFLYAIDLAANLLAPEDLSDLPRPALDEADLALIRIMFREVAGAIKAGSLDSRPDWCLTRFPLALKDDEVQQVVASHRRLVDAIIGEASAAQKRLEDGGAEPVEACVHVLVFGLPSDRWPDPPEETDFGRRGPLREPVDRLADSLQGAILEVLSVRASSAAEVGEMLGIPGPKARYEIERLLNDGWLKVVRTRPRRGTVERVLAVDHRRTIVFEETGKDLDEPVENKELSTWITRKTFAEALESIRTGVRRSPGDLVIARLPIGVDAEGFAAISALLEGMIRDLVASSDAHLAAEDDSPSANLLLSALSLFELPSPR